MPCFFLLLPAPQSVLRRRLLLLLVLSLCAPGSAPLHAQASSKSQKAIWHFTYPNGTLPASLVLSDSGTYFYGVSKFGGKYGYGVVFSIPIPTPANPNPPLTNVHDFTGTGGAIPNTLLRAIDGNFYGTTTSGGSGGHGVVFQITPSGHFNVVHAFAKATDGSGPNSLFEDTDGTLYGTAGADGPNGYGTVFRITVNAQSPASSQFQMLYSLHSPEGAGPVALVRRGTSANGQPLLYGAAQNGGLYGYGAVFKLSGIAAAQEKFQLIPLHSFHAVDGYNPDALAVAGDGGEHNPIIGTALTDATVKVGAVFEITEGDAFIKTDDFSKAKQIGTNPTSLKNIGGTIYGTASSGGTKGDGSIFQIDGSSGMISNAASFQDASGTGASPNSLAVDAAGNFYGTAARGSRYGYGTVFALTAASSEVRPADLSSLTPAAVYAFSAPDGTHPVAALVQDTDGNFYGTTSQDGQYGGGTLFQLRPDASTDTGYMLQTLHQFGNSQTNDGKSPQAALIRDAAGNLYGTTEYGGGSGTGTVFKITPAGAYQWQDSFPAALSTSAPPYSNTLGAYPLASLLLGPDGSTLYGTAAQGGAQGSGTVFSVQADGTNFQDMHDFQSLAGAVPAASLMAVSDILYGTTQYGGAYNLGTVFTISPDGSGFAKLHDFDGANGSEPQAALRVGVDAKTGTLYFYGTTVYGGSAGDNSGTVFQLTPDASKPAGFAFAPLHSFNSSTEGGNPLAPVLLQQYEAGAAQNVLPPTTRGGYRLIGTNFVDGLSASAGLPAGRPFSKAERLLAHLAETNTPNATVQDAAEAVSPLAQPLAGGTVYSQGPGTPSNPDTTTTAQVTFGKGSTLGANPADAVIEGTDAYYYGTTEYGGISNAGTVFRTELPYAQLLLPDNHKTGTAFTLVVEGAGFVPGTVVTWNGAPLTLVGHQPGQLTAHVPASLNTAAGTVQIGVVTPDGVAGNTLLLTLTAPAARLTGLAPYAAAAGDADCLLTVDGTDFDAHAVARWNGIALPTRVVSPIRLAATIPAARLARVGEASVTVVNPGAVASNVAPFHVKVTRLDMTVGAARRDPVTGALRVPVTLVNRGPRAISGLAVTRAALGTAATVTALPSAPRRDMAVGQSVTLLLGFPASAGAAGSAPRLDVAGAYQGDTFHKTQPIGLP